MSGPVEGRTVERPVRFGRSRTLIGVWCRPPVPPVAGAPVVLFLNSGIIHRVGPNRLYVRAARSLAERGIASLRFDLGGIGDSTIPPEATGSLQEMADRDIADALDLVAREYPGSPAVLLGLCSGADNALRTATRDARVAGCVLLDANAHIPRGFLFHHLRRRLGSRRTWGLLLSGRHPVYRRLWSRSREAPAADLAGVGMSAFAPTVLPTHEARHRELADLVGRGCELLFVFSGGLEERYNHQTQLYRAYPLLRGSPRCQVVYRPTADHTFSDPGEQARLLALLLEWITGRSFPASAAAD